MPENLIIRCFITGNPVGTDTWKKGYPCTCSACQAYLKQLAYVPVEPIHLYEVRDTSDDEMYYTLGIFASLEDAKEALHGLNNSEFPISEHAEETEQIEVYERGLGWTEGGKSVFKVAREEYYDEDKDEYFWRER